MRRLLQVGASAEPPVAAVGLAILRELFVARRAEMKQLIQSVDVGLRSKTTQLELGDDAEEENFVDDDVAAVHKDADASLERYQPLAREPRHAKAQHTPLWELFALASHVHPFVSHGATRLLSAETFEDVGENPFQEFSANELLEQLAYASSKPRTKKGEQASARLPYNSVKFMRRKNIHPHERFFHQYFHDSTVRKQQERKAARRKQREEDVDEEGDKGEEDADEADEFFDDYLEEQMPQGDFNCDADIDDDSDDPDLDDFDEEGEDDDDGDDGEEDPLTKMRGEGADEDDGDSDEDDGAEGADSDSDAPSGTGRKGKRKANDANLPWKDRVKAVKKKHAGSLFASPEDFETFLNDEFN